MIFCCFQTKFMILIFLKIILFQNNKNRHSSISNCLFFFSNRIFTTHSSPYYVHASYMSQYKPYHAECRNCISRRCHGTKLKILDKFSNHTLHILHTPLSKNSTVFQNNENRHSSFSKYILLLI